MKRFDKLPKWVLADCIISVSTVERSRSTVWSYARGQLNPANRQFWDSIIGDVTLVHPREGATDDRTLWSVGGQQSPQGH